MAVGGGYLIDDTVHIYRWNLDTLQYDKVWEAGSGIIHGDIYDIAFGDVDNNNLLDLAVASADGYVYLFEQAHIYDPFTNLDSKFDFVWKSQKMFQASSVEIADIDLDDIDDLIVGAWDNKMHVFEYTKHSGYPFAKEHWIKLEEKFSTPVLDGKVHSLDVGDINDNGLPDVVLGTLSGSLYVYENDGIVVPTGVGSTTAPFPNDDDYVQLWNSSGSANPIWNMIGSIIVDDLDGIGGTEAVVLAYGQGAWTLQYDKSRKFYLEQLIKPFETFQTQGMYPLDNWADFMLDDITGPNAAYNVYPDLGRVQSGSYPSCTPSVREPNLEAICYTGNVNSAGSEAPDGVYTRFIANGSAGAQAVYDMGVGEEITTNGNSEADLYLIMKKDHAIFSEWKISVSNDGSHWYRVNSSSVIESTSRSTFAIDLDPITSYYKFPKLRYVKMELSQIQNGFTRELDAIVVPYVAQPLTLAVSATIDTLYFDYDNYQSQTSQNKKVIFGATDGRLIVYNYQSPSTISYRNPASIGNFLTFDKNTYGIDLPQYSQVWDSFTDDQFNMKETIWSIYSSPKKTFIPSWRYISGDNIYASLPEFSPNNERVHHMAYQNLSPYVTNDMVITSNSTADTFSIAVYGDDLDTDTTWEYVNAYYAGTDYAFAYVNSFYGTDADSTDKIITTVFGNFVKDSPGDELITIPWYESPNTLNVSYRPYDAGLFPILWEDSQSGAYSGVGAYVKSTLNMGVGAGKVTDANQFLYNYLDKATTYPSATAEDIDHDGDVDLILSNGRMVLLRNIASPSANDPIFELDIEYFTDLNEKVTSQPIFSPQYWDYDRDGDFDLLYSYGIDGQGKQRFGLNFYKNIGDDDEPVWERAVEIVNNPSVEGSLRDQNYTNGVLYHTTNKYTSAYALWVYRPDLEYVRELKYETGTQSSFVVGTNPEVKKLEVNKLTHYPTNINYGYTITSSWSNGKQFKDWTLTMATGTLDGDNNNEVVVSDFDNNVYVFEHLTNNTYKRAFKTHNLNHTVATNKSPYAFQELDGVDGNFDNIIFDHGNLLATGFDGDGDGNKEFVVTAALSVYIFEATGFNDEFELMYGTDIGSTKNGNGVAYSDIISEFSAISTADDFDGRGGMIALAASDLLFMLRYDPTVGWVESYQGIEGHFGYKDVINEGGSTIEITLLKFADINQNGKTELWVGGKNYTQKYYDDSFLQAFESNAYNYYKIFTFSEELITANTLHDIEISDNDYDGNFEFVIAHDYGVDIWEVLKGNGFNLHRSDVISSNPSYGSSMVKPTFGTYQSTEGLGARRHEIYRLSNGKYVVVYGNETQAGTLAPLTGIEEDGVLWYAVVDDPSNIGAMGTHERVSSEVYGSDAIGYAGYTLVYESEPSIIQTCNINGCAGDYNNTYYIAWIAYYTNAGNTYSRFMVQRFQENGVKISTSLEVVSGGPRLITDTYSFSSPALTLDPYDESRVIYSFIWTNQKVYNWFIKINSGGSLITSATYNYYYMGLSEYYIHSMDSVTNPNAATSPVNKLGLLFSGYSIYSAYKINSLYYASFDENYKVESVIKLHDGLSTETYPSVIMDTSDSNKLIVAYEETYGGITSLAMAYSSDAGRSWSSSYPLNTKNPYLTQTGRNSYLTETGKPAYVRYTYRPRLSVDGNGGIRYNFMDRYLVPQFMGSTNYNYNTWSFFGFSYSFATQLFVGQINQTNFFNYDGLTKVHDISLGDTDRDGRQEILVAQEHSVSLLEITEEKNGLTSHIQKWQSDSYDNNIGSVSIFDLNGNEFPEIVFNVEGGEVYSFELIDHSQIINNDLYLLSHTTSVSGNSETLTVKDTILSDADGDGKQDLIIGSDTNIAGMTIWDVDSDTMKVTRNDNTFGLEKITDSRGTRIVRIISDSDSALKSIFLYNSTMALQHTLSFDTTTTNKNNYLIHDTNNDGNKELILLEKDVIKAYNPFDGSLLWENNMNLNGTLNFVKLTEYSLAGNSYFGFIATDLSTQSLLLLVDMNGNQVASYSIPVFGDYMQSIALGDYDNDATVEFALLKTDTVGTSSLFIFELDVDDFSNYETMVNNYTIPINAASNKDPLQIYSVYDGEKDNLAFAMPSISGSLESGFNIPSYAKSGIFVVDPSSATIIWDRVFANTLSNFEVMDIQGSELFLAYVRTEGAYVLNSAGQDLFHLNGYDNPISVAYNQNEFILTDEDGRSDVYTLVGKITETKAKITPATSVVKSRTVSAYSTSKDEVVQNIFSNTVDVTGNGIDDLVVGFSNGTIALRNYQLGEYWRTDFNDFSSMQSTGLKYGRNKYGLAVATDSGQMLIFDRITPKIAIQTSSEIGGQIDQMIAYNAGEHDFLLLTTSTNKISIFNPSTKSFIWNSTLSAHASKIKVGNFDKDNTGTSTHIIALLDNGIAKLIPLPNTLVNGGNFPTPTTGGWIDFKSFTQSNGLTGIYLIADSGEIRKMVWELNGGISEYSQDLSDSVLAMDIDLATQTILLSGSDTGVLTIKDTGSNFNLLNTLDIHYLGNYNNRLYDIDGDDKAEFLIITGTQLTIMDDDGSLLETHSFSSVIEELTLWQIDKTGDPVYLVKMANGDVQLSDPNERVFSQKLMPISYDLDIVEKEPITVYIPDATWTEYLDNKTSDNFSFITFIGIMSCITATILIVRRFKR